MRKTKIDLKNKTLSIDITKVLKNQKIDFKAMSDADKFKYVLSHLGIRQNGVEIEKTFSKRDIPAVSKIDRAIDSRFKNYFLQLQQESCKIGSHSPKSDAKYFGVEIECLIPFESLNIDPEDFGDGHTSECSECESSGRVEFTHRASGSTIEADCPSCEGSGETENDSCDSDNDDLFSACRQALAKKIKEKNIRGIDIKEDGSLDTDGEDDTLWPVEITVLFRQDEMKNLEKICQLLNDLETKVNSSCGLHVHIDSRHLSKPQVLKVGNKFNSVLPFLGMMVPKSRTKNRYCQMSVSELDGERYHAVNLTAFKKYKTVEIRLHSSTTSFEKISNWVKILSSIYSMTDLNHKAKTLSDFCRVIGADSNLQNYIVSRAQKFNGTTEEETPCESEVETEDSSLDDFSNLSA